MVLVAGAVTMLAACTSESENGPSANISLESIAATQQVPVTFGTYMGETAITRAGTVGSIEDDGTTYKAPAVLDQKGGFGVFANYSGFDVYKYTKTVPGGESAASSALPNFMYNQFVDGTTTGEYASQTTTWDYSPKKFWPNDNATADGSGATGSTAKTSKVSFFAYAPYVTVSSQADATAQFGAHMSDYASGTGIIAMSGNNYDGNPSILYRISTAGQNVDLLWGTAGTSDNDINNNTQSGAAATDASSHTPAGNVNINFVKQKTAGQVQFDFKHALAQVGGKATTGGLEILADIDGVPSAGGAAVGTLDAVTRVTVKSITIKTFDGYTGDYMPSEGGFDLATGLWSFSSTPRISFTQTLGTGASVPGSNQYQLAEAIRETSVTAFAGSWTSAPTGVTTTKQNVYQDSPYPMLFIPGSKPKLTFIIDYIVRTADANLAIGYSEVEQTITKNIEFTTAVEMNKRYNILMRLGLTSVKFDATVSSWTDAAYSVTPADQEVHLPINVN